MLYIARGTQNNRGINALPMAKSIVTIYRTQIKKDKKSEIDPRGIANDNFNENVVNSTCDTNGCKRSHSSKILEIGMILGEKMLYFDFRCHIVEEFNKGIYDYIIATDENIEHGGSKNSGCILLTNIF